MALSRLPRPAPMMMARIAPILTDGLILSDHLLEAVSGLKGVEKLAVEDDGFLRFALLCLMDALLPVADVRIGHDRRRQFAMHLRKRLIAQRRAARRRFDLLQKPLLRRT